jgi:type IV pilus assembly protein PilW
MVALVIGLLAMIVVLQVFWLSEGSKRTSTSGGDAQQSGALALYQIQRDLLQAGYGMNSMPMLGCTLRGYDAGPPVRDPIPPSVFVPVFIAQGAGNASDTLTISYGNDDIQTTPATLTQANNGTNVNYQVTTKLGFDLMDLIVVTEAGNPDCTLAQVNNIPPPTSSVIIHNTGVNNPRYNKASGIGISYNVGALVYNLGQLPVSDIYTVVAPSAASPSGVLTIQNSISDAVAAPLADGIINLQAEYGADDGVNDGTVSRASYVANDGIVDHWTTVNPTTPAGWGQIIAVRVVVVARSSLREKINRTTGACDATANMPSWSGSATSPITLSDDSDGTSWRCYRYKTYEATVPLRNMIWKP